MTLSENSSLAGANDIISIIYHLQWTSILEKNYIFEGIFVPRQLQAHPVVQKGVFHCINLYPEDSTIIW